jgi:hypothetical protein
MFQLYHIYQNYCGRKAWVNIGNWQVKVQGLMFGHLALRKSCQVVNPYQWPEVNSLYHLVNPLLFFNWSESVQVFILHERNQNSFYIQLTWVRISIRVRCTTLCDRVCQWLAIGWWFSLGPPVSSTNKTDCHDITEILLKVALNSTKSNHFKFNN